MRLLLSALSCNASIGSEALVGFKYAEALARRHQVTILASPPSQTPPRATMIDCDAGPCSFNEVDPLALLRFELRQRRLARSVQFDLVHRVTPSSLNIPTWSYQLGQPLIVGPLIAADRPPSDFESFLCRPRTPPTSPRWHPRRILARLCRMIVQRTAGAPNYLRHAKLILVGTRTALDRVPESWKPKCRLITYSGIEHDVFGTAGPRDQRTANGGLRLLFVGRLIPYKGLELLLHAVARAAKQIPLNLTIVGAGDPLYLDFLLQLAREFGLQTLVALTRRAEVGRRRESGEDESTLNSQLPVLRGAADEGGSTIRFASPVPRDQLPALYQQADLFCFPTLCDTYGISLLEAMSCGCPVLVSDVAGAGEIVNGENGLKIPLVNPEQYIADYSDKIITLARNPSLRARLGAAARQYILREHDWSRIGNQILSIYDELAEMPSLKLSR